MRGNGSSETEKTLQGEYHNTKWDSVSNRYVLVLGGFTHCLSIDLLPTADRHVPSGFALRCEYSIRRNSEYHVVSRKLLTIHIFCHKVPNYKCLPAIRKTVVGERGILI